MTSNISNSIKVSRIKLRLAGITALLAICTYTSAFAACSGSSFGTCPTNQVCKQISFAFGGSYTTGCVAKPNAVCSTSTFGTCASGLYCKVVSTASRSTHYHCVA